MIFFTFIISMIFISNLAHGDVPKCGQPVSYDKYNSVTYNDIDRRSSDKGIFFGKTIMLAVHRPDGNYTEKLWDVGDHSAPISSQISQITYRDVDHLWIISRLGKRLDGAILYDLKDRKIVAGIYGGNFALSPDKKHIAYTYPHGSGKHVIFVDHTLVAPVIKDGFFDHDIEGPKNNEGKRYTEFLNDHKSLSLTDRPKWKDNDKLRVASLPDQKDDSEVAIISGLKTSPQIDDTGSTRSINLKSESEIDFKYFKRSMRMPQHSWQIERVENTKTETIEECIENIGNMDDLFFMFYSISLTPSLESARLVAVKVPRLLRVRRILEEAQTDRANIVCLLHEMLDESVGSYIDVYKKKEQQLWAYGQGQREALPDYQTSQVRASVATYCLTEFGDLDSLSLMAKSLKMHQYGRAPIVPPGFCFYAMHRLIQQYPESKLSALQKELRKLYLEKAQSHFLGSTSNQVTPWTSRYSESDPRLAMQDPEGIIQKHLPNKPKLVVHQPLFIDGTDISDVNLKVDPRAYELFAAMEPFIATIQQ